MAATDGNLSVRLDDERILVTPTGMSKGAMRPSDMVVVDPEGRRLSGTRNVSSEIGMHLLIYRLRDDINAIVHAHPPTATGFCGLRNRADSASGVRSCDWAGMYSTGEIRHARNFPN